MADTPNGEGYAYNFDRRLDRINETISSLLDAYPEDCKLFREVMTEMRLRHIETMEEIRKLIILQREHRIDIMALFALNKDTKRRLDEGGL